MTSGKGGDHARLKILAIFSLGVLAIALGGVGNGSAAPQPGLSAPALLGQGYFGPYRWGIAVEVDGHRKGICMMVAILRRSGTGPGESAQCSAPASTRGNLRSLSVHKRNGGIALTVFGGAFDRRIKTVQAVMFDGKVKDLPFRKPAPNGDGRRLSRFRYVALAIKGPWCIAELVTRDREGTIMLQAKGRELFAYFPEHQCPGAR